MVDEPERDDSENDSESCLMERLDGGVAEV